MVNNNAVEIPILTCRIIAITGLYEKVKNVKADVAAVLV
jgi:hypothetical protein